MASDVLSIIVSMILVFAYLGIMIYFFIFICKNTEVNDEGRAIIFAISQVVMAVILFHEIYEMIIEVVTKF